MLERDRAVDSCGARLETGTGETGRRSVTMRTGCRRVETSSKIDPQCPEVRGRDDEAVPTTGFVVKHGNVADADKSGKRVARPDVDMANDYPEH